MSQTTPTPGSHLAVPGAHIADPAPLGLAAFALTTFVLMLSNTRIIPADQAGAVLGLALAYGGVGQFVAGIWEFAKGNTFGATAFCSYGAFWVSYWWLVEHDAASLGAYLLAWGIFTLYMTVAASRVSGAVLAVFALLALTFFLLAIGNFDQSVGWIKFAGWVGIATALAAWYTSFAGVTNFTFKRAVLPTFPR
jgi:succinate-acetate transporter protein